MKFQSVVLSFAAYLLTAISSCKKSGDATAKISADTLAGPAEVTQEVKPGYPYNDAYIGILEANLVVSQCPPESYSDTDNNFVVYITHVNTDSLVIWGEGAVTFGLSCDFTIYGASRTTADGNYLLNGYKFKTVKDSLYVNAITYFPRGCLTSGTYACQFAGRRKRNR